MNLRLFRTMFVWIHFFMNDYQTCVFVNIRCFYPLSSITALAIRSYFFWEQNLRANVLPFSDHEAVRIGCSNILYTQTESLCGLKKKSIKKIKRNFYLGNKIRYSLGLRPTFLWLRHRRPARLTETLHYV